MADTHRFADVNEGRPEPVGARPPISGSWKAALVRELGVAGVTAVVRQFGRGPGVGELCAHSVDEGLERFAAHEGAHGRQTGADDARTSLDRAPVETGSLRVYFFWQESAALDSIRFIPSNIDGHSHDKSGPCFVAWTTKTVLAIPEAMTNPPVRKIPIIINRCRNDICRWYTGYQGRMRIIATRM